MYRILFFVILFIVLIPIVWRIVNRIFFRVSNELSDDGEKADDVIGVFLRQKDRMDGRAQDLEEKSRKAKEESGRLDKFIGNENKTKEQ